jgi:hypothetical protein
MSTASNNMTMSDLHIISKWENTCSIISEEPPYQTLAYEFCDTLEDVWTDDEDSDPNIMDFDEQILFNLARNFDNEPPQAQLDSIDLCLERNDDYLTCRKSPVSPQSFPFANSRYREAFNKFSESTKRSHETRVSLELNLPHQKASKFWEERRSSIKTVLSSTETSSTQIQQTFSSTIHAPTSVISRC